METITATKNRLKALFESQKQKVVNVYFTAGYPELTQSLEIIEKLEKAGADIIEIGIPFSDPIADGPTIQESNQKALDNGMTLELLFKQLEGLREKVQIPVLLMGYINPVLQFGFEAFCKRCKEVGVDGLILPDMPLYEFEESYRKIYEANGIASVFLITPETKEERIRHIAQLSSGFVYMVSSSGTTGKTLGFGHSQIEYFERVGKMQLQSPVLVGFGISDKESFDVATRHANGAIIGSAFIRFLSNGNLSQEAINAFVSEFKNVKS